MQIREIKDALPAPLGALDDAITSARRIRVDWCNFGSIDAASYSLARGASETSRHVAVALEPVFAEQAERFFSSLPLAVALMLRQQMVESDQDAISLFPGTENLRISPEWEYLSEGNEVGPLTEALREIPWMHQGLLKVMLGGAVAGKLFLDNVGKLRNQLMAGEENLVPLWLHALRLTESLHCSLFSQLQNPWIAVSGFSQILRPFLHFMVPEEGLSYADGWWAWLTVRSYGEVGREQLAASIGGSLQTDKMRVAIAEELHRNISPVRAAGEVLQHNPKPFTKNADDAFYLWVRLRAATLVEQAVGLSHPENPLAVIDSGHIHHDEKLPDRLQQLGQDRRFAAKAGQFKVLADQVKMLSARSGRRERAEIGSMMLAVGVAIEETCRMLSQVDPAGTPLSYFTGDRTAWLQAVEEGRIYGFAPDVQVHGVGMQQDDIGHLFLDMKDFSVKSARLRGGDLAEFMRWDFYDPLLNAVKKHYQGLVDLTDKGGIFINNLLGDALSLCGDAATLIEFAEESAIIFSHFEEKLRQRRLQESRKQELLNEKSELQKKIVKLQLEVARLKEDDTAVNPSRKREKAQKIKQVYDKIQLRIGQLDRAIARRADDGEEIPEWGTYIGWGPSPIYLGFEDDVFGSLGVALAESINETARGTVRDTGLFSQLQKQFQSARTSNPELEEMAFRVAIGQSVSMEIDEELQTRLCLTKRETLPSDLSGSAIGLRYTDVMYNNGIAISAEALAAYLQRANNLIHTGTVTLSRAETAALLTPCWHPPEALRVLFVEHEDGTLRVFRRVGDIHFKGFEAKKKKAVWELISESMTVYSRLLEQMNRMQEQEPEMLVASLLSE